MGLPGLAAIRRRSSLLCSLSRPPKPPNEPKPTSEADEPTTAPKPTSASRPPKPPKASKPRKHMRAQKPPLSLPTRNSGKTATKSTSKNAAKAAPVPSAKKFRYRDYTPAQLVDMLAEMHSVPSSDQTRQLGTYLTSDPALFRSFVLLAIQPRQSDGAPRDRLPRAWVVASLLRHGPHVLRDTLAENPILMRSLASVFENKELDPTLAAHCSDILKTMLHEFPKQTASALYNTKLPSNLVNHINLQPAATLLPRLVASKVFSSFQPPPVVPAHKKALVLLGRANTQKDLATEFCNAVDQRRDGDMKAAIAIDSCCTTMAEVSARAMSLKRKPEDFDERADMAYAGNLLLVTSHMYNEAKDKLSLIHTPEPMGTVLKKALSHEGHDPDVVIPALDMCARVLTDLRTARVSLLPNIRFAVVGEVTTKLASVLEDIMPRFVSILEEERPVVGRVRLAVLDVLRETCATLDDNEVFPLVCAEQCRVLSSVMKLAQRHSTNDMLLVRTSQLLSAVFTRLDRVSSELLHHTDVVHVVDDLKDRSPMHSVVSALVSSDSIDRAIQDDDIKLKRNLSSIEEFYEERMKADEFGLVKGSGMIHAKVSADLGKGMHLEVEMGNNEDFGQEVYIYGLLDEVSKRNSDAPPEDSVARHAADAVKDKFTSKLKRLKHGLPHGHHHHQKHVR